MDDDAVRFLAQFRRSPRSVGAIVPSSRELAETMIAPIDFANAVTVVEFGPGTGAITTAIAARLSERTGYLGVEINPEFHGALTKRFPHLTFVNRSAEDLDAILDSVSVDQVDAIVCGLPWASLPSSLQRGILNAVGRRLRPGGLFVTFAYLQGLLMPAAWQLRRRLKAEFSVVKTTRIVWNNLPPAFAYVCQR
jgi:phosphatidylethanolamine/phosphatidyl-N-methylethanolamine N-methyltransferase